MDQKVNSSSAIRHPPSVIRHPPSAISHRSSAFRHPPSVIHHPSSVIRHLSSVSAFYRHKLSLGTLLPYCATDRRTDGQTDKLINMQYSIPILAVLHSVRHTEGLNMYYQYETALLCDGQTDFSKCMVRPPSWFKSTRWCFIAWQSIAIFFCFTVH